MRHTIIYNDKLKSFDVWEKERGIVVGAGFRTLEDAVKWVAMRDGKVK